MNSEWNHHLNVPNMDIIRSKRPHSSIAQIMALKLLGNWEPGGDEIDYPIHASVFSMRTT